MEGMEIRFHIFLILIVDEGEWSASCGDWFTPAEGASTP
jgi:hypothetical protein